MVNPAMVGNNGVLLGGSSSSSSVVDKTHGVQDRPLDSLVFREEPAVMYGTKGRLKWTPQMVC